MPVKKPIHDLEEFCQWLYGDLDSERFRKHYYQLVRLAKNRYRHTCYHENVVPKSSGGQRILQVPSPFLKRVQRGILELLSCAELPDCATAYRRGISLTANAAPHVHKPLILKLDIQDFFDNIDFYQVYHAIDDALRECPHVGTSYLNGYDRADRQANQKSYNSVLSFYFARFCTLDGFLTQGAPTSPVISNLVFRPIDRVLTDYCEKRSIAYTRYSDDMTFSGEFGVKAALSFVHGVLSNSGFMLNEQKIIIVGQGCQQKVTGLVVNDMVQTDREYRRTLRQELYYLQKFGPQGHLEHKGIPWSPEVQQQYLIRLTGRVNYVLQTGESREFLEYRRWLMELLKKEKCVQD